MRRIARRMKQYKEDVEKKRRKKKGKGVAAAGSKSAVGQGQEREEEEFWEWSAEQRRVSNAVLTSRNKSSKEKGISFRAMLNEPDYHLIAATVLFLDILCYVVGLLPAPHNSCLALTSAKSIEGLPQAFRLAIKIMYWYLSFSRVFHGIEGNLTFIVFGKKLCADPTLRPRALDSLAAIVTVVALIGGKKHAMIIAVPRIVFRVYLATWTHIRRARRRQESAQEQSTELAKTLARLQIELEKCKATNEKLRNEVNEQEDHNTELERTLLIAAESAAAGMSVNDLKRLAKLAASGDMY